MQPQDKTKQAQDQTSELRSGLGWTYAQVESEGWSQDQNQGEVLLG